MDAIPIENATRRLGAPKTWDHAQSGICHTLNIVDQNGWMVSAWQPSASELKRLCEGQPLFLHIQGVAHPVVALTVANPNQDAKS